MTREERQANLHGAFSLTGWFECRRATMQGLSCWSTMFLTTGTTLTGNRHSFVAQQHPGRGTGGFVRQTDAEPADRKKYRLHRSALPNRRIQSNLESALRS